MRMFAELFWNTLYLVYSIMDSTEWVIIQFRFVYIYAVKKDGHLQQ